MANPLYRDHFQQLVRHAVEQARQAAAIAHHGQAGNVRELLVRDILRPALPAQFAVETNVTIVDHMGGQSPEVDVVVYDLTVLPPLVFGATPKIIPIDACVYAIEVKTRLTATEVSDALAKAERIARLQYVSELMVLGRPRSRVVTALFAFATDLTGAAADEVQRVTDRRSRDRHPEIGWFEDRWYNIDAPALKVLCVAGRCYAWHGVAHNEHERVIRDPATGAPGDYMWQLWPSNGDEYDEVIAFVAGLTNTAVAESGRKLSFGDYLISP
jgi:hypothetical protein